MDQFEMLLCLWFVTMRQLCTVTMRQEHIVTVKMRSVSLALYGIGFEPGKWLIGRQAPSVETDAQTDCDNKSCWQTPVCCHLQISILRTGCLQRRCLCKWDDLKLPASAIRLVRLQGTKSVWYVSKICSPLIPGLSLPFSRDEDS